MTCDKLIHCVVNGNHQSIAQYVFTFLIRTSANVMLAQFEIMYHMCSINNCLFLTIFYDFDPMLARRDMTARPCVFSPIQALKSL